MVDGQFDDNKVHKAGTGHISQGSHRAAHMGYTGLVLAPEGAEGSMDDVRVWSRGTALNEIEREAIDLMEFWSQDEE